MFSLYPAMEDSLGYEAKPVSIVNPQDVTYIINQIKY